MKNAKIALCLALLCLFSVTVAYAQSEPKVNINTATVEELTYLPRIGPATADNILYAREQGFTFETCEDLTRVSRIGEKTRDLICPHVVFSGPTTATGDVGGNRVSADSKFKRPESDD